MASEPGSTTWPLVTTHHDWQRWNGPGAVDDGLDALATLVELGRAQRLDQRQRQSATIQAPLPDPVLLVGLAGAVASGKSTVATTLADRLATMPDQPRVEVISTDGFLRRNQDLEAAGLTLRKGFPESYDLAALRALHRSIRNGDGELSVPVYSHEAYDVADEPVTIVRPDVIVLEGVNALQGSLDHERGPGDLVDLAVYLDADETLVIEWYVERFLRLTEEARRDETSFYRLWADLPDDAVRNAARDVWESINAVNLRDHIAPSRARADIVARKGADHEISEIRLHPS